MTFSASNPAWRSLLFVPATSDRFIQKAADSAADAIILDLEDAVLEADKARARECLADAVAALRAPGRSVLVRINRPLSLAVRDVEASVAVGADGLVIAKTEGPEHVKLLAELVDHCEAQTLQAKGVTQFVPLIESAGAIDRLDAIAAAPRVAAIVCGDEDLATELGCEVASRTIEAVKHQLVHAAARYGCHPIGLIGSIAEFRDLDRFADSVAAARREGLRGTLCIHPAQVDVANKGFAPAAAELDCARRVIAAAEEAANAGSAAVALDGKMIDPPIVERARRLLAQPTSPEPAEAGPR